MNKEYGLFIIWSNARNEEKKIINYIDKNFKIINIFEITWQKSNFSTNLTRFYGENLPPRSYKEKHCGNNPFLLIITEDQAPVYKYRNTTGGMKKVNINYFDGKELLRYWTGGGHKIHATNDTLEFRHDLMLLLGVTIEDYFKKYNPTKQIIKYTHDIIGTNGWSSLSEIFNVLNETSNYVVLRNYELLPEEYTVGEHGDIDILCDNYNNIKKILLASEESRIKSRVRNYVNVNGQKVFIDLRYVGDNYYCKEWEKRILKRKRKNKDFYIPSEEDFKYTLLYHALIHKKKPSNDYLVKFNNYFKTTNTIELRKILDSYLKENDYEYIDPNDISVYFNRYYSKKKSRLTKKLYYSLYPIISRIEKKEI